MDSAFNHRHDAETELEALRGRVRELEDALARIEQSAQAPRQGGSTYLSGTNDAEHFLRQVLDLIPHIVFAKDEEGRYLVANKALARTFGIPVDAIFGRTDTELAIPPEEARRFQEEDAAAIRGGEPRFIPEERVTDAAGETRLMQTVKVPFQFGATGVPAVLGVSLDVTERRRAETSLKLNEARLEALLRINAMGNASLREIASHALEEAVRLTQSTVGYIAFASPDETVLSMHAWSTTAMAECAIEDKPIDYPVATTGLWGEAVRQRRPIITNDYAAPSPLKKGVPEGHVALTRHMNVPVFDGDRIVIVAGVGNKPTDYDDADVRQLTLLMAEMWRIVQRQRAEEALRAKTVELDRFFSVALDLLCIAGTDGVLRRVNQAWERTLGFTTAELEGRNFMELVHPDDREATLAAIGQLSADQEVLDLVNRYRCKDGTYRYIEWRSTPIGDLIYAAARDVTDKIRAAEALRTSEQMLRNVLDHFPGVVFWKDRNSVYQGCNRAFSVGGGVGEPEHIVGKTDFELPWAQTEAAKYRADDREVMDTGRPKVGIVEPQLQADGGVVWFNTSKVPLHGADGSVIGVLGTSSDITEMRRLEERYRQAQKMEAVGQLAGGVAHDFNNLLQVISGCLELATLKLPAPHPALAELQEVARAAARASTLVRQLLTFSRRDTMRCEVVDLDRLIAELTKMLRRVIEEHIELRTSRLGEVPRVMADPGHLEQVLLNLCVNARDAMPHGGLLLISTAPATLDADTASRIPGAVAGEYAVLSVSDTGSGIKPEDLERIFEPFFTTKEVGKGTGLGLSTVYGIVQQHGGFIEVTSTPAAGTTFRIHLPAHREEHESERSPLVPAAEGPRGTGTVLVAEDDEQVRRFASRVLRDAGYRVLEAGDGAEALEILAQVGASVDLLVLDAVMPLKGGCEVYRAYQAERPDVKALLCTGYSQDCISSPDSFGKGLAVLKKPFTAQALLRQVRDLLDSAHP